MPQFIEPTLRYGLTNQKMMLLSAIRVAIEQDLVLVEPRWAKPECDFSAVYDFDYFSRALAPDIQTISRDEFDALGIEADVRFEADELWAMQREVNLEKRRQRKLFLAGDIELRYWRAFRLIAGLEAIVADALAALGGATWASLHMRIERDWFRYSEKTTVPASEEAIYVSPAIMQRKILASTFEPPIEAICMAVSPVERQRKEDPYAGWPDQVRVLDKTQLVDVAWDNLAQAVAVDFELALNADYFIGTSRSSFSSMACLQRTISGRGHSYIHNIRDRNCVLRLDGGLFPVALECIDPAYAATWDE